MGQRKSDLTQLFSPAMHRSLPSSSAAYLNPNLFPNRRVSEQVRECSRSPHPEPAVPALAWRSDSQSDEHQRFHINRLFFSLLLSAVRMQGVPLSIHVHNLLCSAPNGIPLERLDAEFYMLYGNHITLGASRDLKALLEKMRDVCSIHENGRGQQIVTVSSHSKELQSLETRPLASI